MTENLHQSGLLTRPARGRRFWLGAAGIAFLLVLPVACLGLLVGARERTAERSEPRPSGSGGRNRSLMVAARIPTLQEILAHPDRIPTHHHPLVGKPAPDFELADDGGKVWDSQKLRGNDSLVLIFYHGYLCPNCVRQLFEVNRELPLFAEVGARVAAISADPPDLTQERFQEYGRFDFPILSDPGNNVRQEYHVFRQTPDRKIAGFLRHGIFLINRQGTVRWANVGDAPFRRNSALLYQLAKIQGDALQ